MAVFATELQGGGEEGRGGEKGEEDNDPYNDNTTKVLLAKPAKG